MSNHTACIVTGPHSLAQGAFNFSRAAEAPLYGDVLTIAAMYGGAPWHFPVAESACACYSN